MNKMLNVLLALVVLLSLDVFQISYAGPLPHKTQVHLIGAEVGYTYIALYYGEKNAGICVKKTMVASQRSGTIFNGFSASFPSSILKGVALNKDSCVTEEWRLMQSKSDAQYVIYDLINDGKKVVGTNPSNQVVELRT